MQNLLMYPTNNLFNNRACYTFATMLFTFLLTVFCAPLNASSEKYAAFFDAGFINAENIPEPDLEPLDLMLPSELELSNKTGLSKTAFNCLQVLPYSAEGYQGTGREWSRWLAILAGCAALADSHALLPYSHNYLPQQLLTEEFPNAAPADFMLAISNDDIQRQKRLSSWAAGTDIEESELRGCCNAIYYTSDQINMLDLIAIGDFNGDGIADAVINVSHYLREGSYSANKSLIITRYHADGPLVLLHSFIPPTTSSMNIHALQKSYAATNNIMRSDIRFINRILLEQPINRTRVTAYNDIAYYLERDGHYESAVYLLKKIIEVFPNRTVAYINLGDAYWGFGNQEKANEAYQNYIRLMRNSNREQRIPQRVFERINER